jgi:zinc protease
MTPLRCLAAALVACVLASAAARAEAPGQSLLGAPLPLTVRTLANGLTVAVVENRGVPLVTIEVAARNGSITQPPEWSGLSHLWEHMFFKANATLPDQEAFLRRVRELGIVFNGTTGVERVNYYFTLGSDRLSQGLQFMSDALRTPRFDPEEFAREKEVVLGEYDRNEANPQFHLWKAKARRLWGELLSRKDPLGDRQAIQNATLEQMQEMKRLYYVPNNCILVVAGDVRPEQALQLVEKVFGDWERAPDPFRLRPPVAFPPLAGSSVVLVEQPVQNVTLSFSWIGPDTTSDVPATIAADVYSYLLNQPDSRLHKALVDAGLVDQLGFGYQTQRQAGEISLNLTTSAERAPAAFRAALAEMDRLDDPGYFTADQLKNAQTLLAVGDLYGREVASDLASTLTFWWASADLDYYLQYIPRILATTPQDLQRFARVYVAGRPLVAGVMASPQAIRQAGWTAETFAAELRRAGLEVLP